MRISLKIHTLALWKVFLFVFILILCILSFYLNIKEILLLSLLPLALAVLCFFLLKGKYIVFHKYQNVKDQIDKVLLLLSLENKKIKNSIYIKKYNMNVLIINLGFTSIICFSSKSNSKEIKYLETVMLKYQYSL